MDKKTVKTLNELNRQFYLKAQKYFNRTRQMHWPGWQKLLPYLQGPTLKVLDVGCGNGRFGKFLKEKKIRFEYTGLDNNDYLLQEAKKAVPGGKLIKKDLLSDWQLKGKYDLVVLFGILHHVPGYKTRMEMLKKLKGNLKKEGLLVVTLWQFKLLKRFRNRIAKWPKEFEREKNDYLLDWRKGVKAWRYAHFFNEAEIKKMIKELNLKLVTSFEADAKGGRGNQYVILKSAG